MKRAPALVFFLLLSCGATDIPPPTSEPSPEVSFADAGPTATASTDPVPQPAAWSPADFRYVIEQALDAMLTHEPVFATGRGDHRFDDKWPELSAGAQEKEAADFKNRADGLRTLAKVLPPEVSGKDQDVAGTDRPQLDALVLADALEALAYARISVRRLDKDPSAVVELIGGGVTSLTSHEYAPKRQRFASLSARLLAVPDLVKAARDRLGKPTRAGIENMQIVSAGLVSSLRTTFAKTPAASLDGDAAAAAAIHKAASDAAAAIEAYAADVVRSFPIDDADTAPIGAEMWAHLARLKEGVTDAPADVRKMGDDEARRLTGELDALMGEYDARGRKHGAAASGTGPRSVAERAAFFARLQANPIPGDRILDEYRRVNRGVEEWLKKHPFATIPWDRVKLEIVQSPPEARGTSFASMNAAGALEPTIADARFEVNVPEPSMPPQKRAALSAFHALGAIDMVSIHEALPGHYLQLLDQKESPSKVRKVLWAATLGEGWAHYCEEATVDAGYTGADPLRTRAFYLRMALQRAARVIVDVGENDGSLTLDAGAKVLETIALLPREAAVIEARRAVIHPANMFAYTYGKLAILKMKEAMKAREGDRFDLVRFHDRLLSIGAVPVAYAGKAAFGLN